MIVDCELSSRMYMLRWVQSTVLMCLKTTKPKLIKRESGVTVAIDVTDATAAALTQNLSLSVASRQIKY